MYIYLWILKDLSWAQSWFYPGVTFGCIAVAWSMWILLHASRQHSRDEVWTTVAGILWLFANFWWEGVGERVREMSCMSVVHFTLSILLL